MPTSLEHKKTMLRHLEGTMAKQHKLFLPWKVVESEYSGRLAIVDSRNNGDDIVSGRVCNLPKGKDGRGKFVAEAICAAMNGNVMRAS